MQEAEVGGTAWDKECWLLVKVWGFAFHSMATSETGAYHHEKTESPEVN
jgi:hypothetical protein